MSAFLKFIRFYDTKTEDKSKTEETKKPASGFWGWGYYGALAAVCVGLFISSVDIGAESEPPTKKVPGKALFGVLFRALIC